MRAKRLGTLWLMGVAGLGGLLAGCGSGNLVFQVDVYSFLKGTGQETVAYAIPPNTSNLVVSSTPQKVSTPGAGSSLVDSVLIFGTLDLQNQSGTGTLGLQLFIAGDSAGTYNPSAAALTVAPKTVSGAATIADTVSGSLLRNVDSLFAKSQLWFRVAAQGSNASLVTPVVGTMVLKSLILSVWMRQKLL
jgi:hypothetical protein